MIPSPNRIEEAKNVKSFAPNSATLKVPRFAATKIEMEAVKRYRRTDYYTSQFLNALQKDFMKQSVEGSSHQSIRIHRSSKWFKRLLINKKAHYLVKSESNRIIADTGWSIKSIRLNFAGYDQDHVNERYYPTSFTVDLVYSESE